MEIASLKYAILAIISIFIYYALNPKLRVGFLSLLSIGFIATYNYYLVIYILAYTLINYYLGLLIPHLKYKKIIFRGGIIINMTQLIVLKYASFLIDPVFQLFNSNIHVSGLSAIIIPIGVSYFTLQGIGYLINVKMGWEKPEKNFLYLLLYLIFFPKFLSGPIERSNHFLPQLSVTYKFSSENVTSGLRIAFFGFFKKIIIANHLAATVSHAYSNPDSIGGYYIFAVILIQPLYLYFDFSGYTDMAVGIAKAYGIEILPNFNRPFLSQNMTNFWRRFHISLSSWFNDYLFKQTSFRLRHLKNHSTTIAVFLTWILFGIWHGAGWNFMLLGILQALAIYYEYRTRSLRSALFSRLPGFLRIWVGRIFTYSFYAVSLTFFFSPDLSTTMKFFSGFAGVSQFPGAAFLSEPLLFGTFFALCFLLFEIIRNDYENLFLKLGTIWTGNKLFRLIIYYGATALILTQLNGSSSFIYEMF